MVDVQKKWMLQMVWSDIILFWLVLNSEVDLSAETAVLFDHEGWLEREGFKSEGNKKVFGIW